ncbi:helix-turn-helix domain-containing protein [Pseudomonas sp. S35]|uniref:helix-turn-helix domain-containing protein n=1 Tax=Pseudomonas sp. S35 TaxID=1573719 RepID=UPI00319DE946
MDWFHVWEISTLFNRHMSLLEVSIACGFESPSYFTRSYRARFAKCPREDRRREVV